VGEVAPGAANLPDPFVRFAPALLEQSEHVPAELPGRKRGAHVFLARLIERVRHLAVDIELLLRGGRVADPYRLRVLEARQPLHDPLGQPSLTGDPVHDLDVIRVAGHGPQQPGAPLARLIQVAGVDERKQRQRRVAEPAVAVVPVALAAGPLRQRCRRRGDDPSRRTVGEALEDDERLQNGVPVGPRVTAARRPFPPERLGLAQRRLGVDGNRKVRMRGEPGQRERHPFAGADLERRHRRRVLDARRYRPPQHERVRAGGRNMRAVETAQRGDDPAVAEPDHELGANADAT
jgi:hypothetical protein